MNYILYLKDRHCICPKCGGYVNTLKSPEIILQCIDCWAYYRAIDFGQAEAELLCEEVGIGV